MALPLPSAPRRRRARRRATALLLAVVGVGLPPMQPLSSSDVPAAAPPRSSLRRETGFWNGMGLMIVFSFERMCGTGAAS